MIEGYELSRYYFEKSGISEKNSFDLLTRISQFEYPNEFDQRPMWLGPAVEFLRTNLAPGQAYLLEARREEKGAVKTTFTRFSRHFPFGVKPYKCS